MNIWRKIKLIIVLLLILAAFVAGAVVTIKIQAAYQTFLDDHPVLDRILPDIVPPQKPPEAFKWPRLLRKNE